MPIFMFKKRKIIIIIWFIHMYIYLVAFIVIPDIIIITK